MSDAFNPDDVQSTDKTVLYARLAALEHVPHYLARPIALAASKTRKQLRIVLVSPLFDPGRPREQSALGTTRWDQVQSVLTYVYVQATKVAQEMGKILMDVDVLLRGENESLPESVTADVHVAFRVTTTRLDAAIDRLVPNACETVWVPPSEDPDQFEPQVTVPLKKLDASIPMFYPVVALGGTFDHLHAGHKILLSLASWIARDKLIVGITDDSLLQKKANKNVIQSITQRIDVSRSFLQLFRPQVEYDMVSITDVCGPTAWDANIQALVVSKETISGADYIDKERREKSLPPLHRFVIDVISHSETNLDAEDADALKRTKMSSTFIREWIVQQRASGKSP